MQKFLDVVAEEVKEAFEAAGYDRELGKVSVSNRPDLCEYQCNGCEAVPQGTNYDCTGCCCKAGR